MLLQHPSRFYSDELLPQWVSCPNTNINSANGDTLVDLCKQLGRKCTKDSSKWKRNILKKRRASREECTNSLGTLIHLIRLIFRDVGLKQAEAKLVLHSSLHHKLWYFS